MEEKKQKKRGYLKGCLIVFLIIVLVIGGVYFWGQYRIDKAERTIALYLQKKYHREFTITNGQYIWATGTYTFDASPKDDPEFKFPVFAGLRLYENGIGDMYKQVKMGREVHKFLDPFVDAIFTNNCYGAMYGPGMHGSEPLWETIMSDIYRNNLTPLQAVAKYPGKIYINTDISYVFDVNGSNKEKIFKKVFNLVEFLKKKKFGYMSINIRFFPLDSDMGKAIINKTYKESKPGWTNGMNYQISFGTENTKDIKTWQDIRKFSDKKIGGEFGEWVKDKG